MRNPNRLYDFYDKLRDIHMEHFPDWRFGQFMTNFLKTCQRGAYSDPFYWEEDRFLEEVNKFVERMKGDARGV